eukprot:170677-Pyramimonas_sp.AAC.1
MGGRAFGRADLGDGQLEIGVVLLQQVVRALLKVVLQAELRHLGRRALEVVAALVAASRQGAVDAEDRDHGHREDEEAA